MPRKRWIKKWMRKRDKLSHLNLINELRFCVEDFKNYFRMSDSSYDKLLTMVTPYLKKQDTHMRQAITPDEKLALTLRFLATGRSFEDLKFSVIRSARAISTAVIDTCEALIYVLQEFIKVSK
ncbi:hypothetical protein NQ314_018109 [Rhamnusium bicolor]|uniref:Uncharacterized protein n=1 Tax=Rhamnusium bicolor TaxID=1586634 RepID=A0AAV8WR36_9CUCU|nr:hypothetical protein NQ314_018109 [Rhamnusium bicolor]